MCSAITKKGNLCKYKSKFESFCGIHCVKNTTECAVCMEIKSKNILLKCNHSFCNECINNWLSVCKNGPTCPLCRTVINDQNILLDAYSWGIKKNLLKYTQIVEFKMDMLDENEMNMLLILQIDREKKINVNDFKRLYMYALSNPFIKESFLKVYSKGIVISGYTRVEDNIDNYYIFS